MRPGEIFALTRGRLEREYVDIQQRVYRGVVDSPKTVHSRRWAALSEGLMNWTQAWLEFVIDDRAEAWVDFGILNWALPRFDAIAPKTILDGIVLNFWSDGTSPEPFAVPSPGP
jgi:hypothetical protein